MLKRKKGRFERMVKLVDFAQSARSRSQVKGILRKEGKQSVSKETRRKYRLQRGVMQRFLKKRGWSPMTTRRFEDFLAGMVLAKRAGRTASTYLAAWLFWREVDGLQRPSEKKLMRIRRAIKGMSYKSGKAPLLPRGALDSGMLRQLRWHCRYHGLQDMADGFALIWYGMLRHSQVLELRRCDVRFGAAKGPLLALGKKKAFCADRCSWRYLDHFKEVANCRSLLRHVCKGKGPTDKLFPKWRKGLARALIREASRLFEWDPSVKWDGAHCMRHGAAQEWAAVRGDKVRSIMRRATWDSCRSAALYGKRRGRVSSAKGVRKTGR